MCDYAFCFGTLLLRSCLLRGSVRQLSWDVEHLSGACQQLSEPEGADCFFVSDARIDRLFREQYSDWLEHPIHSAFLSNAAER